MPPKVSQLLTRVLAREHADDDSNSSASEELHDLKDMAANASAGLRMEMAMVREGRARDMEAGVDKNACIVDCNQFFNTQVGVGYQHKSVVRQRTAERAGSGPLVVDMSVAPIVGAKGGRGGKKRRRQETREGKIDDDEAEKTAKKVKKAKKSKKKSNKSKKDKKSKKQKREKKSRHGRRRHEANRRDDDDDDDDDGSQTEDVGGTSRRRKHKKRSSGEILRPSRSPISSSPSSSGDSSDSGDNSDDCKGPNIAPEFYRAQDRLATRRATSWSLAVDEDTMAKARAPLQQLRNLIEEKLLRARAREHAAGINEV